MLHADTFFCVVDLHAITLPHEPKDLLEATRKSAALYIASGINPDKASIFVQSHVSAHAELAWLLQCYTPIGQVTASDVTLSHDFSASTILLSMSPCIRCVQAQSSRCAAFHFYLSSTQTCLEAICIVHVIAAPMSGCAYLVDSLQEDSKLLRYLQVATAHDPIQGEVAEPGKSQLMPEQIQPRMLIFSPTIYWHCTAAYPTSHSLQ